MIELNNRYALDGCDRLGVGHLLDAGPLRSPVGAGERSSARCVMSSENTARKVRVRRYMEMYGE